MHQHGSIYIKPIEPPLPTLGLGSKVTLFQNMLMLHIKLTGMTNSATCNHSALTQTSLTPGWGQKVKTGFFFTESSYVAYQI